MNATRQQVESHLTNTVQYTAVRIMYNVFHAVNDRKNNLHHFNKFLSAGAENLVSSCSRSYTQFSLLESI